MITHTLKSPPIYARNDVSGKKQNLRACLKHLAERHQFCPKTFNSLDCWWTSDKKQSSIKMLKRKGKNECQSKKATERQRRGSSRCRLCGEVAAKRAPAKQTPRTRRESIGASGDDASRCNEAKRFIGVALEMRRRVSGRRQMKLVIWRAHRAQRAESLRGEPRISMSFVAPPRTETSQPPPG